MSKKIPDYEKGFNVLIEYFDYLPDEDKDYIDKELTKCGL
jgi:hypothetical protein